jgi:hypothetical protein
MVSGNGFLSKKPVWEDQQTMQIFLLPGGMKKLYPGILILNFIKCKPPDFLIYSFNKILWLLYIRPNKRKSVPESLIFSLNASAISPVRFIMKSPDPDLRVHLHEDNPGKSARSQVRFIPWQATTGRSDTSYSSPYFPGTALWFSSVRKDIIPLDIRTTTISCGIPGFVGSVSKENFLRNRDYNHLGADYLYHSSIYVDFVFHSPFRFYFSAGPW